MSFAKCSGDESHSCFVVVNDLLYGITALGGDNDQGVIFSFDPATSTPTPTATPACTPANYQALYTFLCSPPEDAEPHGRLTLDSDGTTLYGMTREGGSMGYGVVFKVDTSGNHTLSCTTLRVDMTTVRRAITVTLFGRVTISTV